MFEAISIHEIKEGKKSTYERAESISFVYRRNSISETGKATNPDLETPEQSKEYLTFIKFEEVVMNENEREARPPHKRSLSQEYLSRKHFIELAVDEIEHSQK